MRFFLTSIVVLFIVSLGIIYPLYTLAVTASDGVNVNLTVTAAGTSTSGGDPTLGSITGWIYEDLDANGVRGNEPALGGWQVFLYQNDLLLATVSTAANSGIYNFSGLLSGDYDVCEGLLNDANNWVQTDPNVSGGSSWRAPDRFLCANGTYGYHVTIANSASASDNVYSVDFGNTGNPVVSGVPNVSNFQAVPNNSVINLTWVNPVYPDLGVVRIVRLAGSIPLDPNDGQLIYEGTGQSFTDTNVTAGVTYFYTAFVRNTTGQYSSGVVAQATITADDDDEDDEEPPPDDEIIPPPGGGGDIFDTFSEAIDITLPPVGLIFSQPGLGNQIVVPGGQATIDGAKILTVFLPLDAAPPVLKTIGLTLFAPGQPRRSFTFLLRLNNERTGYMATIAPLGAGGVYNFTLHIINYQDQRISRTSGSLVVSGVAGVSLPVVAQAAQQAVVGVGLALGATQLLLATTQVKSILDIYLILLRGLAALAGALGLRRKREAWGTVYDAVTKRPIDPALVSVLKAGQETTSAITDIDGRYGFFLPVGTYTLQAGKTNYRFPSQLLAGQYADEIYHNLYFGESLTTASEGEVITKDIPLDPIGFDWNEFVKSKTNFFKIHQRREFWQASLFNSIYLLGAVIALYHALVSPTTFDFVVLSIYLIIYGAQRWWQYRYPVLHLKRANGELLPYSIVHVFLTGLDQEVKKVITDELGRFYLLVRPGEYYFMVEEKLPDATYQEVYRSAPQTLKTGILKTDLIVP
ncbi:MAG: carboxypeptidase regulatory-like domain-containing protein [bacterium]|nr:carboxypeptidase regulatory-like domain-containing protein [bacterium]